MDFAVLYYPASRRTSLAVGGRGDGLMIVLHGTRIVMTIDSNVRGARRNASRYWTGLIRVAALDEKRYSFAREQLLLTLSLQS